MIQSLTNWLDDRTGYRQFMHEALYERVPGGARWRYVWGSTLVFVFFVQLVTGLILWMHYSPSAQTAWESVYYIQNEVAGGWLVRGIHHYAAQFMVLLLILHVMQVVIDGAYRAPREINFWLGIVLMKLVLGLALTGYLLPWDQKGFWATQVATKIASNTPLIGEQLQSLVVGGTEYGHHTLTRFFALHAGLLPALLVAFLVAHLALFRRHGVKAKQPCRNEDATFWPDQVLRDGVACLAVLAAVLALAIYARPELGAPANPAESYDAARPEWYFLFLYQFLKYFPGQLLQLGAIFIPAAVMGYLFLMPLIGRWRVGHWLNVTLLTCLFVGAGWLTYQAVQEDTYAEYVSAEDAEALEKGAAEYLFGDRADEVQAAIAADVEAKGTESVYAGKPTIEQLTVYAEQQPDQAGEDFQERAYRWQAYQKSRGYLHAVEAAERDAERMAVLAQQGIPPTGALSQLQNDPKTQGPKLFARYCASCHLFAPADDVETDPRWANLIERSEPPTAANLYDFASREWLTGLFDAEKFASEHYFGNTPFAEGEMAMFLQDEIVDLRSELEGDELSEFNEELSDVIIALSAEAGLPAQAEIDAADAERIERGRTAMTEAFSCTTCHDFRDAGDGGTAPDLTGYGSRQWLIDFIGNPGHSRFYGDANVMPAFQEDPSDPIGNTITRQELELIVDWLRRDWYEADAEPIAE